MEEPRIKRLGRLVEREYETEPTGTGSGLGEILCHEIHEEGMTFVWLTENWGVSLPTLGEIVWDHCKLLEGDPEVDHGYHMCHQRSHLGQKQRWRSQAVIATPGAELHTASSDRGSHGAGR